MALFSQPPASQHHNINKTIVVIVGLDHIERADFAIQTRLMRPLSESAISVISVIAQRTIHSPRRDQQIDQPVVIKIVCYNAAGQISDVQPKIGRDISKSADVGVRSKSR